MEDGITYVTLHRKYRGSTVIWRDDCAFCLEAENSDFRTSVLDNRELIENHIILTYYDGEKICNWKELQTALIQQIRRHSTILALRSFYQIDLFLHG